MCFVVGSDATYPKDFKKTSMTIFKRLFRVFAIIYCSHFDNIEQLGAAAHLNTSFKVREAARKKQQRKPKRYKLNQI